ncbi:Zinc finger BED domain-containing protein RICESLEEPER 3 [Glycine max]|nr:Zinc finger BED domain-containing protein RICESLEEPER 3 [Glycine max]
MRGMKGQTFLTPKVVQGKQELGAGTYDAERAREELAKAIIMHEYPLSIVDHLSFRRYSAALQPVFQVPTRNTIKKEIMKIYENERATTLKLLDSLDGRVAITSDMWTSTSQKRGYMAITAHYVDGCWNLQSQILSEVVGDALSEYDRFIIRKKKARSSYVKSELDHYLEDVLPRAVDFDILMWWKFNGVKYPTLQAIAKDILAILVSIVASESAFSTGGQVLSPHRSRLQWTTLEALMCARSWLWSAENIGSTSYKVVAECANVMNEMVSDDEGEMMGVAGVTNLEE